MIKIYILNILSKKTPRVAILLYYKIVPILYIYIKIESYFKNYILNNTSTQHLA